MTANEPGSSGDKDAHWLNSSWLVALESNSFVAETWGLESTETQSLQGLIAMKPASNWAADRAKDPLDMCHGFLHGFHTPFLSNGSGILPSLPTKLAKRIW